MSLSVHKHNGVQRYLQVFRFQVILDGVVEVFRRRLFHHDRLGQRLRLRLGQLERCEKRFWRRRLKFEV